MSLFQTVQLLALELLYAIPMLVVGVYALVLSAKVRATGPARARLLASGALVVLVARLVSTLVSVVFRLVIYPPVSTSGGFRHLELLSRAQSAMLLLLQVCMAAGVVMCIAAGFRKEPAERQSPPFA